MKLQDIINESDSFKTTKTHIDPETGAITWDVEYTPLVKIDRELETMVSQLDAAVKQHPDDEKLQKLADTFRNWKKVFRSHVTRRYSK